MTQEEKRRYLIQALLEEQPQYREMKIPAGEREQRDLLRALMNVRSPAPVSPRFLEIQDAYLAEELRREGAVESADLPPCPLDPRISLWQGDITRLRADAIVNAANSGMLGCFHPLHNCIDNCIHTKSGVQLRLYCHELMKRQGGEEPPGRAKITPAFNLPSRYILHTVGPIVQDRATERHRQLLAQCYHSCLELAAEYGLESLAFCCISTGVFRFPNRQAAEIAVDTVRQFLQRDTSIKKVIFNVFKEVDAQIYGQLLG